LLRDALHSAPASGHGPWREAACVLARGPDPESFLARTRGVVLRGSADEDTMRAWIGLILVNVAAAENA
jgi:hypothetical protein